ncbi:MAG TPA: SDR family oxidoreductase [Gemmatimonadaceae bacterium]|nr:SDR family oxidoreductase [Gemmatimonadaceae bacterium]
MLVTGVGRAGQVGEAVARELARRGARIIAVSRSPHDVEARVSELRDAGHAATGIACDLADARAVQALARRIARDTGGRLDALVHLAGGFALSGPVADAGMETWQRMQSINLTTAFLCTHALLPCVREARGAIVYVASAAALPGGSAATIAAYAAAKAGVLALMRAVAEEERPHGVRANAIAPGAIRTASNVAAMGADAEYVERDHVAAVIAFLCSSAAHAVTGQVIALA